MTARTASVTSSKPSASAADLAKRGPRRSDSPRETIESIAFAFVLAFLFRAFVAEAFVIPTGSMAPTLLGRNKSVTCEACGLHYAIGASDELDRETSNYLVARIKTSLCPNCRYKNDVEDLPVFRGDRILVNKFPYEFGDPQRWDVVVFRYPEDPERNYIKRLVGLPGEAIRIQRGDLYARRGNDQPYEILRKQDPNKQRLLQQLVYDDHHPPQVLLEKGWPERWQSMRTVTPDEDTVGSGWGVAAKGWQREAGGARALSLDKTAETSWLRYQHFVPSMNDWLSLELHDIVSNSPRPRLISDFCGYNMFGVGQRNDFSDPEDDCFWVGDLTLNATVTISDGVEADSELVLELVEGVRRYRCRFDVAKGVATISHTDDLEESGTGVIVLGEAPTALKEPGTYQVTFANVDNRLCVWVNDSLLDFGEKAAYSAPPNPSPQGADLSPAGISAKNLTVKIDDLLLQRDIYYRAEQVANDAHFMSAQLHEISTLDLGLLHESLSDPEAYANAYNARHRVAEFRELGPEEFFVLGDNSPRSQDSRLWPNERQAINRHAVPRQAMLGKAFLIYWPHGIPFLNDGKGYAPVPALMEHQVRSVDHGPPPKNYPHTTVPFYPQYWRWQRIR